MQKKLKKGTSKATRKKESKGSNLYGHETVGAEKSDTKINMWKQAK